MLFFLLSGPPNSGKTTSIIRLANYLHSTLGYSIIHPTNYIIPQSGDVRCILEKTGKKILLASETDQIVSIDSMLKYYNDQSPIDLIITAARDEGDNMRDILFHLFAIENPVNYYFEIPLGRMVRGSRRPIALGWYLDSVFEVSKKIGGMAPFNF